MSDRPAGVSTQQVDNDRVRVTESPCRDKICIAAGWLEKTDDWTACLPNRVFVRVVDNGCGIEASGLHSVFTPFFSTKGEYAATGSVQAEVKGPGLGLSVSESIVRQHGGTVTAESVEDKGSTFTVWLPLSG